MLDNTDVPNAYRPHCLKVVGNRWRDWKCRLKKEWYDKYETNEERLAILSPYRPMEDTCKECYKANKANRALGSAPHRTGRTSFAQTKNKHAVVPYFKFIIHSFVSIIQSSLHQRRLSVWVKDQRQS
ncbi:Plant transposase Ptta/En/Spm family [Prunus dulcis]|uniref:Plant transposase Ptta/En/Spm family n=1 Tax=Prunus dulcis TaxID=3755 RepID=A0A4Y1R5E1_PRUDU|nr:Plant transposase Ptta/En/Spm family [Prunus dulcis]